MRSTSKESGPVPVKAETTKKGAAMALTKAGNPRKRAPGGGAKPKPAGEVTKPTSVSLYPNEVEEIKAIGGGFTTPGVRRLLEHYRATHKK